MKEGRGGKIRKTKDKPYIRKDENGTRERVWREAAGKDGRKKNEEETSCGW